MTYLYLIKSPRRIKIGIGWNLNNRVNQIDRTTKGKQRLILAVILPFRARQVEAWLHRRYKRWHAPLKYGSGRSEYFWAGLWVVEAVVIMAAVSVAQWALVWGCVYLILLIGLR